MSPVIQSDRLPGTDWSRRFEGEDHDVGLSFFLVDAPPGHGPKLHRHPYEEVFVVRAGKATFTLGDSQLDAGAGDVVVAPAETPHRFENSGIEQLEIVAIHHAPRFVTDWLE
jgi:mannose-6-phosphate isomerase-like protein (cupin superfamily)